MKYRSIVKKADYIYIYIYIPTFIFSMHAKLQLSLVIRSSFQSLSADSGTIPAFEFWPHHIELGFSIASTVISV